MEEIAEILPCEPRLESSIGSERRGRVWKKKKREGEREKGV
ncbi:hypothetical protein LOK49_LG05G00500 [Camellia lanceoleosa]|uniref:Uncharacterized protein n=1 Tax=Camellia lanceoleosa TaxID=1840588 RepID=A0ACC0HLN1_9ERIC|nr:hypothetical protein LOK49_LG05G00500 [Camellia lanceoleosa]